ncbi:MAG: sortase [Candidatus Peribacteraceae bacterium]|nr:sortase [Candidatus Peribacteraceae bacterium]
MMRKGTLITFVLALAGITSSVSAATFADVAGTGYADAYSYLVQEGIVEQGRPYDTLNRAEALKVVLELQDETSKRAAWYRSNMPVIALFPDVRQKDWFASYIETAYEKRIVTGYPDGKFHPGRPVSVEEAVTLLMRTYGETGSAGDMEQSLRIQNAAGQWYTPAINAAIKRNLIAQNERLLLGAAITRGQFFSIVHRMHVVKATRAVAFSDGASVAPAQPVASVQAPLIAAPQPQPAAVTAGATVIHAPQPVQVASATVGNAQGHQYGSEKYFSITIPKAGITDLTITHPVDPFTKEGVLAPLQSGVGHLFSYPGGGGKIMVYGHSSGYPWDVSPYTKIFRKINTLQAGDRIYVTYSGTLYMYEVTFEEAIDAADTSRFQDNGSGEELILYTCWPPDSIQQRYLVHAIPVGTVALR